MSSASQSANNKEKNPDYQSVNQQVFPSTARRGSNCGELKLQGIKASTLAATYGTPLYIVDEPEVRERARKMREVFESEAERIGTTASVYYASKALLNIAVAQWITEEGLSIDVATGGELQVALAAGVDPARIGLHGNNKSVAEIERAVEAGVGTIVIDSEQEIDRVAEAAKAAGVRQKVRLRVNSGVHASTHDYLATSHEDQKFGLPLKRAPEIVKAMRNHKSLEFIGLHCHIGSQIFATEGFEESARRLLSIYGELAEGGAIAELNLGGGYGIAYTSDEASQVPDIAEVARDITDSVAKACAEFKIPIPKLAFEPGRSITGPAGITLYEVGTTKKVELAGSDSAEESIEESFDTRLYVSVDGGMSDNARPALYGAQYEARLANRRSEAAPALARVVGKHCESGDIVVDRGLLPADICPGDLVAVAATGAYCWSLSSNYNYLPRPPMVAVKDGVSRLIVRGQREEELIAQSITDAETINHTSAD
ncbi:MAG TPA: diaminopimelate decarboxylase [Microbacteriaceae bacterium]|nr:diaminopimelate decarboxylase [Microbacteriaceae bacterium]